MTIQEWFDKRKEAQIERRAKDMKGIDVETPELWTKCVHCDTQILKSELEDNMIVFKNTPEPKQVVTGSALIYILFVGILTAGAVTFFVFKKNN